MNRVSFSFLAAILCMALPSVAVDKSAYKWEKTTFLAPGVGISKCTFGEPRLLRIVAIHIDLKKSQIAFTGTGRAKAWDSPLEDDGTGLLNPRTKEPYDPELCKVRVEGETVTSFFKTVNATPGREALIAFPSRGTRFPRFKHTYDPWGLYISEGEIVSDCNKTRSPIFVVRKDGAASIETTVVPAEYPDILLAHSGSMLIRRNGECVLGENRLGFSARVGIGLTADKQQCYIIALDGGSTQYEPKSRSSYYDLDEAFEALGVSDAMAFELGATTALIVRDPTSGEPLHLNPFGNKPDETIVETNIGIYRPVKGKAVSVAAGAKAAPAAAPTPAAKTPEQITAKIQNVRLDAAKEKLTAAKTSPSETTLRGQFHVSVRSSLPRFKRPVANVVALFDIDGSWRYCDVVLSDKETSAGLCLNREQTVARISKGQTDVTASDWRQLTYGDPKVGFFKQYRTDEKAKLICYRVEIWQNGVLVDSYDSGYRQAKRQGVPEDWYIKGKHPGAISYRWPPAPKAN